MGCSRPVVERGSCTSRSSLEGGCMHWQRITFGMVKCNVQGASRASRTLGEGGWPGCGGGAENMSAG